MEWITMDNFKILLSNVWYLFKVFLRFLPFLIVAIIFFIIVALIFNQVIPDKPDFSGNTKLLSIAGGLLFVGFISGIGIIVNSK